MARPYLKHLSEEQREEIRRMRRESRLNSTYKAFLRDFCEHANLPEQMGEQALTSVLCLLEQRLMGEEALDLESQLPAKLVGLLLRCEHHWGLPPRKFGRAEMVRAAAEELGVPEQRAEGIIRAVFTTVAEHVSPGEVADVYLQLPQDIRELWALPEEAERVIAARLARRAEARRSRGAAGGVPRAPSLGASAEESEFPTVGREPVATVAQPHHDPALSEGDRNIQELTDRLLELPLNAQLGIIRTVAPRAIAALEPHESGAYLRDLFQEVDRALHGQEVYDVRPIPHTITH